MTIFSDTAEKSGPKDANQIRLDGCLSASSALPSKIMQGCEYMLTGWCDADDASSPPPPPLTFSAILRRYSGIGV
jgi:hypothetical protein